MNKIRMIYMASIKEKIASFLLHNVEASHTNIVPLRLSRKQLADRFGVQKSSLIRTLNDLEHSNLIFVREKEIVVLNVVGLKMCWKESKIVISHSSFPAQYMQVLYLSI